MADAELPHSVEYSYAESIYSSCHHCKQKSISENSLRQEIMCPLELASLKEDIHDKEILLMGIALQKSIVLKELKKKYHKLKVLKREFKECQAEISDMKNKLSEIKNCDALNADPINKITKPQIMRAASQSYGNKRKLKRLQDGTSLTKRKMFINHKTSSTYDLSLCSQSQNDYCTSTLCNKITDPDSSRNLIENKNPNVELTRPEVRPVGRNEATVFMSTPKQRQNKFSAKDKKNAFTAKGKKKTFAPKGKKNISTPTGKENISKSTGKKNISKSTGKKNKSKSKGKKNISSPKSKKNMLTSSKLVSTKVISVNKNNKKNKSTHKKKNDTLVAKCKENIFTSNDKNEMSSECKTANCDNEVIFEAIVPKHRKNPLATIFINDDDSNIY